MLSKLLHIFGKNPKTAARLEQFANTLQDTDRLLLSTIQSLSTLVSLLKKYPNNNFPEQAEILSQVRIVTTNPQLYRMISEFADLMHIRKKYSSPYYLPHAEHANCLFYQAARAIRAEDVLALAKLITHRHNILQLTAGLHQTSAYDYFAQAIAVLSDKCPAADKVRLFEVLERSGYLQKTLERSDCQFNGQLLCQALAGTEIDEALHVLNNSPSWQNLPKTNNLKKSIQRHDERLLAAIRH